MLWCWSLMMPGQQGALWVVVLLLCALVILAAPDDAMKPWKRPHYDLQHIAVQDLYYQTITENDLAHHDTNADIRRSLQQTQIVSPFTPLRFYFDTRVIESARGANSDNDAKIDRILNQILPAAAATWSRHLSVQALDSSSSGIPINNDTCSGIFADFFTDQVLVPDADLVIVVGGDPQGDCREDTLAFAAPCQLHPITDRPIVGLINFCLDLIPANGTEIPGDFPTINGVDISAVYSERTGVTFRQEHLTISLEEITIHELTHALGQASQLYVFFRDKDGVPRTPRDSLGQPIPITQRCIDGSYSTGLLPSNATVQVLEFEDGRIEQYLITPHVKTIASNLFHCQTLLGGRLSNDGMCVGNHWHERLYFADLLSPVISDTSQNSLSLLTLALLDDSGWYQVDYRGSVQPGFGINVGCPFVEEACIDGSTDQVASWVENEFCDVPITLVNSFPSSDTLNHIYCDPTYVSWTICDLGQISSFSGRTYFSDSGLAPVVMDKADACPIPHIGLGLDCRIEDDSYNPFYPGEAVGEVNSRCIGAYYVDESSGGQVFRPACISVTCVPETQSVLVGDLTCSNDGEILPIPGKDGAFIICPRLAAICPDMFLCPFGCFGRGECIHSATSNDTRSAPTCRCFDETNTDPACKPPELIGPTGATTMHPVGAPTLTDRPPTGTPLASPSSQSRPDSTAASTSDIVSRMVWIAIAVLLLAGY